MHSIQRFGVLSTSLYTKLVDLLYLLGTGSKKREGDKACARAHK